MDIQYDLFAGVAIVIPANDDLPVIEKIDVREKLSQLELPIGGYGKRPSFNIPPMENLFRNRISPGVYVNEQDVHYRPPTPGVEPFLAPYRGREIQDAAAVYAPYIPIQADQLWFAPAGLNRGVYPARDHITWSPPDPREDDIHFTLNRVENFVNVEMPVVRPIENIRLNIEYDPGPIQRTFDNWAETIRREEDERILNTLRETNEV